MNRERFFEIFEGIRNIRAAVVGDIFLDVLNYVDRSLDEPSAETGLPAFQVVRKSASAGAAGVGVVNMASLGASEIYAVGLQGEDGYGFDLAKDLQKHRTNTDYMIRSENVVTPSYVKTFFDYPEGLEEYNRLDIKNLHPIGEAEEEMILRNLDELQDKVDVFYCLEQIPKGDHGIFTPKVIEKLAEISQKGKLVLIDSRYHIENFHDVIIKCNHFELMHAFGYINDLSNEYEISEQQIDDVIQKYLIPGNRPFFISCGSIGMKVPGDNGEIKTVKAYRVDGPIDICGAGDSALTGIAAALAAGANAEEAALIGNLVASVNIQQLGVTGICSQEQLEKRFDEYLEQQITQ